jgi:hypothetical protein
LRRLGASTADILFSRGTIFLEGDHDVEILPLLKFEWVGWVSCEASCGRGQGRAKPGAANP